MSSAMPVPTGLRTAERGDGRCHARRPAHERLLKPNGQAGAFSVPREAGKASSTVSCWGVSGSNARTPSRTLRRH